MYSQQARRSPTAAATRLSAQSPPAHAHSAHPPQAQSWPQQQGKLSDFDDFDPSASAAEAAIRHGFLRKVFGLVTTQLLATVAVCCLFM